MSEIRPDGWRRLLPILEEAMDLPPEERRRRIESACAGHPELRPWLEPFLDAAAETRAAADATVEDHAGRPHGHDQHVSTLEDGPEGRLLPGARVAGRYRIVNLLGRGGMGEVYRADDLKLGQPVALKFLPPAVEHRADQLRRLLEETKLARQVAHPNVCRVYDVGEWDGRHFLTMEYIDGENLASLLARIGYLPRQKALDISRQLCAGLDAAHQLGILHRDLKPSNVMLDGKGRVRITDFGLAIASTTREGRETRAGTPAYMSPEQLEGGEATARSDIYALGLLMYELFTGRPAFPGDTLEQLRRLRLESSPVRPTQLVDGLEPSIERAILRCLEHDAEFRPASAREVAMLLPAGDPIAAAIAAGETPSPDIVAASGPEGSLRPRTAYTVFGAALALLGVLLTLSDRASILGWVAWTRSVAALEDNARGMLARLGHDAGAADRDHLVFYNGAWVRYVTAHDSSPGRWERLREPGQFGLLYQYRQSPRALVPSHRNGHVTSDDPPPRAGDATVVTDLRGQLIFLLVTPDDADEPQQPAASVDWSTLLREAGLDSADFAPAAPTRNPLAAADARAAWTGTLSDYGGYPVRVEAAAHRGRPVFFELVVPWDDYWDPAARRSAVPAVPWAGYALILLFVIVSTGVLVVRNWTNGRADRSGAFRVAAAVFVLRFLVWVLGGHHVPSPHGEWLMLLVAVGKSLTDAAFAWCFYLALEPYGRRLHPRFLVSWTRLLHGRVRDPLVGRDILCGMASATAVMLTWGQLYVVIPHALKVAAPPAPVLYGMGSPPLFYLLDSPPTRTLLGGRHVLEALPAVALAAFGTVLVWMTMVLAMHLLLRKGWAALAASLLVITALAWPSVLSNYHPFAVACSLAGGAAILWAMRFGLVGALSLWSCVGLWMNFPVTSNLDAPHFGTGLVAVLLIAALGAFGAWTASRPAGGSGYFQPLDLRVKRAGSAGLAGGAAASGSPDASAISRSSSSSLGSPAT